MENSSITDVEIQAVRIVFVQEAAKMNYCSVHLPGQNVFCLDKNFSPMLKKYIFACEMDRK